MPKKSSVPFEIAKYYVEQVQKRTWVVSDARIAMAHAKSLLKDYSREDILACLEAIKDGIVPVPYLNSLAALRHGEPAIIERWFEYKRNPPPVYMETLYNDWLRRTGAVKPEQPEQKDEVYAIPLPI